MARKYADTDTLYRVRFITTPTHGDPYEDIIGPYTKLGIARGQASSRLNHASRYRIRTTVQAVIEQCTPVWTIVE